MWTRLTPQPPLPSPTKPRQLSQASPSLVPPSPSPLIPGTRPMASPSNAPTAPDDEASESPPPNQPNATSEPNPSKVSNTTAEDRARRQAVMHAIANDQSPYSSQEKELVASSKISEFLADKNKEKVSSKGGTSESPRRRESSRRCPIQYLLDIERAKETVRTRATTWREAHWKEH